MEPVIKTDLQGVKPEHLVGFFEGWPTPPSPETHLRVLNGSSHVAVAWYENRLIGFCNAVSDGVLSAYIPLLEVLPEHRGHGLGARLLAAVLEQLQDYYMIDLTCDAGRTAFYVRNGMRQTQAMSVRNYANQAGIPART